MRSHSVVEAIINDLIVNAVNTRSNMEASIVSIAKHFKLNHHLNPQRLRQVIGDCFIESNEIYPSSIYKQMDSILIEELQHKQIVDANDIPFVGHKLKLFRGDITLLRIDGIVNAANTEGLGCFIKAHKCIDNVIHRAAGPRLRRECKELFQAKQKQDNLPTGSAIITNGYCLPSKHVIHTTGPVGEKPDMLKSCYKSVLDVCRTHKVRSVAFCCISTGLFGYPPLNAAKVAIQSVEEWMKDSGNAESIDYVLFNVFTQKDHQIYQHLLT